MDASRPKHTFQNLGIDGIISNGMCFNTHDELKLRVHEVCHILWEIPQSKMMNAFKIRMKSETPGLKVVGKFVEGQWQVTECELPP